MALAPTSRAPQWRTRRWQTGPPAVSAHRNDPDGDVANDAHRWSTPDSGRGRRRSRRAAADRWSARGSSCIGLSTEAQDTARSIINRDSAQTGVGRG